MAFLKTLATIGVALQSGVASAASDMACPNCNRVFNDPNIPADGKCDGAHCRNSRGGCNLVSQGPLPAGHSPLRNKIPEYVAGPEKHPKGERIVDATALYELEKVLKVDPTFCSNIDPKTHEHLKENREALIKAATQFYESVKGLAVSRSPNGAVRPEGSCDELRGFMSQLDDGTITQASGVSLDAWIAFVLLPNHVSLMDGLFLSTTFQEDVLGDPRRQGDFRRATALVQSFLDRDAPAGALASSHKPLHGFDLSGLAWLQLRARLRRLPEYEIAFAKFNTWLRNDPEAKWHYAGSRQDEEKKGVKYGFIREETERVYDWNAENVEQLLSNYDKREANGDKKYPDLGHDTFVTCDNFGKVLEAVKTGTELPTVHDLTELKISPRHLAYGGTNFVKMPRSLKIVHLLRLGQLSQELRQETAGETRRRFVPTPEARYTMASDMVVLYTSLYFPVVSVLIGLTAYVERLKGTYAGEGSHPEYKASPANLVLFGETIPRNTIQSGDATFPVAPLPEVQGKIYSEELRRAYEELSADIQAVQDVLKSALMVGLVDGFGTDGIFSVANVDAAITKELRSASTSIPGQPGSHHCPICKRKWCAGDPNIPFGGVCDQATCNGQELRPELTIFHLTALQRPVFFLRSTASLPPVPAVHACR